ncbi:hypothetical protein DSO57_1039648 [Entomophthora muscae]|uniref:Uncharacterized protein n=1 Tax=Entomophthora muscae TaxID=34485 RepID=A0ACC2TNJ7_9FUNG|nr:hypothetical protein DSO57_1039648 [Entomophthora muscae]
MTAELEVTGAGGGFSYELWTRAGGCKKHNSKELVTWDTQKALEGKKIEIMEDINLLERAGRRKHDVLFENSATNIPEGEATDLPGGGTVVGFKHGVQGRYLTRDQCLGIGCTSN